MPPSRRAILGMSVALGVPAVARAASAEDFYRGATLRILVASGAGGINDLAARLVARHLPRFLQGAPRVVVENLAGAGGMILANRLFNSLERDGTVIAALERGTPQAAILGDANARFDVTKLNWLGSVSSYAGDAYLLIVNAAHPARVWDDLRKPGIVARLGTTGPGATNRTVPLIARELFGLNLELVRGYPGAPAISLAMQNGEVDGQIIGLSSLKAEQAAQWAAGKYRPLMAFGRDTRHPDLPNVPTAHEVAYSTEARELIAFTDLPFHMALPFAAPPGLPSDRAVALRAAFAAMFGDAAFLGEGQALRLDVSPVTASGVEMLVADAAATSREVVRRYARVVTSGQ